MHRERGWDLYDDGLSEYGLGIDLRSGLERELAIMGFMIYTNELTN